jgi:hypothetical protein
MSYDALMRWEWEGGASTPARERDEPARPEPAENTLSPPQPTNAHQPEGWQDDGNER